MPDARPAATLRLSRDAAFTRGDGRVEAIEGKDALLLAYLALEGPTPRRVLAGLLWPDVDGERARANLRQRLFRLRKSLGRDLLEGGETTSLCADLEVDLDRPDDGAGALLQGIHAADAGGLGDWLDAARERRRAGHARTLAGACAQLEAAGDIGPAIDTAQQLVDLDPTSEHSHRRLMRLHYLRGDRAAALAAFDRCCDVLEQALGVAPDAETEALRARVASASLLADSAQRRALPLSVLRPPRLVGREQEWQALGNAWDAGAASLIAGDAGLGKSRLLADFVQARPGCLSVAARPGDGRVPHALLSRFLRQLLGRIRAPLAAGLADELATLLPDLGSARAVRDSSDRMRFLNAVELLLRQAKAEGLAGLAIDDLQFADPASVEVLQHLAAADLGLNWLIAFRPDELAPEAQAFHDEFLRAGAARLHVLRPLRPAQVADLLGSLGVDDLPVEPLAPALTRHTGGNPMFILETLKVMLGASGSSVVAAGSAAGKATLPAAASVRRLIEQRIGRLSSGAVRLARCAALAGPDFSAPLATQVLGLRALDLADSWAELESAQVLRDSAFAHDLIFEAARDSVPAPVARQFHAEIAAFLEAAGAEPARVAQHWLDAGEDSRALPALVAAAERAASAWRPAEEGAFLHRAAAITRASGGDPAAAFALLKRAHRAHLQANLGSPAHLQVIDALAALATLPIEHAYARFARADTLAQRGDGTAAEPEARAGLAAIEGQSGRAADEMTVDLTAALANALFVLDRPNEGADAVRAIEPRLLALNDRQREIEHYANLGVLLDAGNRHVEAQPALLHVIALARAEGDRTSELMTLSNLASSLYDVGLVPAALETLQGAYRMKEAFPELRTSALFLEAQLGNVHRALGHYGEALEWQARALPVLAEYVPAFVAAAHNGLARIWLDLGQLARARQHLQQALERSPVPAWSQATTHLLGARLAFEQSHRDAAARSLALAEAIQATRFPVRAQARLLAARLEEPEAAYRIATAVALDAGRLQVHGVRMDALACAARLALACGHPGVAATHAAEALALWPEHRPDSLYIGEVWRAAVDSLDAAGDPRAATVLAVAVAWIRSTLRTHVAAEFHESFLNRNPANLALLAREARARP